MRKRIEHERRPLHRRHHVCLHALRGEHLGQPRQLTALLPVEPFQLHQLLGSDFDQVQRPPQLPGGVAKVIHALPGPLQDPGIERLQQRL